MADKRDHWGSSLGFILAAAGSAVGLGNLWKFPYIAYDNNGGAFVLVYLVCIALVGMPIMMAEILIGRRAQASTVPAFLVLDKEIPGTKRWTFIGWMGVFGGLAILCFYAVVAGWSLSSFWQCMNWTISGYERPATDAFGNFLANSKLQLGLTFTFSAVTALIVMRGISGGIEKATKILMPVLLSILVLLFFNSFRMEGVGEALGFLFNPSFENLNQHGVLEALGHAFFTLSLGMGAMITYGSYMNKNESIPKASIAIVVLDTVIAIIACVIMYSIIFSIPEVKESISGSTAGMLFVTLPPMFYEHMAGGSIMGPIFYILVAFAALSSTISLLEVVVSMLVDRFDIARVKATIGAATCIFVVSVLVIFSLNPENALSRFEIFGPSESGMGHALNNLFFADKQGVLNFFDHLAANWLLPVGGLAITIFTGWILPKKVSLEELELTDANGKPHWTFNVFLFLIRFVAPLAILYIIVNVFMGEDFT